MVQEISLSGMWELRDEILGYPLSKVHQLTDLVDGWITTPVPGDIHQGLIAAGKTEEPLLGLNSFDCEWTEKRSWWFRKTFQAQPEWFEAEVIELEMDGLDSNAEIFLNGQHIGSHRNTFRPFMLDIKPWLQLEENVLLVRLTAGVETITEAEVYSPDGILANDPTPGVPTNRGDFRRVFVRKPQYTFGWDWSPRLPTTAIAGDVKIRVMSHACIRHLNLHPLRHGDEVLLTVTATVDRFHYYQTTEGQVTVTLTDEDGNQFIATGQTLLRSGHTFVNLTIPINNPQLWWPYGLGVQHLYQVDAELTVAGETINYPVFRYGLRFVELDTDNKFALVINGKTVFCKGANWIPADAIYARTTDDQYDTLVKEAREANFNMLRIWGGGWFERDAFYQACDRYGLMIWHDFMFACAPYPDHLDEFRVEIEQEVDYQTKRLQRHASLVLWCGSNENNWGFRDWWHEQTQAGARIYNYLLPDVVQRNCPEIPYWNGSPYGGDAPNSNEVGDHHHWYEAMMNPDMAKRITPEEYDQCTSKFVSEFGYVGACSKETTLTYMDGAPLDPHSEVWQHHTNTFEKDTVAAGIRKHYADPETLDIDDYLLYSALCQGLMYSHSLEAMRYQTHCHGSLFWMYNDCWGEVGWTIIDYYLRRKPAWYFVRRAYAPVRIILRADGEQIRGVIVNDTGETVSQKVEYGYISLDGVVTDLQQIQVEVPPLGRTEFAQFPRGDHDPTRGLWLARTPDTPEILPAIFRAADYRQLKTSDPGITACIISATDTACHLQVSAQAYAHAVHFTLPVGAVPSDNYFDLLPGETRDIHIESSESFDPAQIDVVSVY